MGWKLTGLWVQSGAGVVIPLDECGEAHSRTIPGQLLLCGVVKSSLVERAEAVVQVVRVIHQEQEILSVVLERAVPLLQQEDEDSGIIKKFKLTKTGNK